MADDKKGRGAPQPSKPHDRKPVPGQDENLAPIKDPEKEPDEPE